MKGRGMKSHSFSVTRQHSSLAPSLASLVAASLFCLPALAVAEASPIGFFNRASASRFTHVLCTFSPAQKYPRDRYVMIQGPTCRLGGGDCRNVALLNVKGKVVELLRTDETNVFKFGTATLRVKSDTPNSATLELSINTQDLSIKTFASCADD